MLFTFSGTGNSTYVTSKLKDMLGDEILSINDRIKTNDNTSVNVSGRAIFVTPTYAWRIPKVAEKWIRDTEFADVTGAWFVMTCGSEIGNAAKYNRQICIDKGFSYMGTAQIVMPENYTAMFSVPNDEEVKRIVNQAEPNIMKAGDSIKNCEKFPAPRNNIYDKLMSRVINPAFYEFCVTSKPFTVGDNCIGCGKCESLCPMNTIRLESGRPVWGDNCTHCMACINHCTTKAIEYGKKSVGKPRYHLD